MSSYIWDSNISYADYLQAKNFVNDVVSASHSSGNHICMEISKDIRKLISSNEILTRKNIQILESAKEAIIYSIDKISDDLSELKYTFHWGFSNMLAMMGRMNDSLSELINIAKTPAQTAAYEQYEIARDAFRKELYTECMESLEKAISTYKIEWRFYQMKGILELGFVGCNEMMIDLTKAEESFLLAARYAKIDAPEYSAKAYLSSSWAAYCQGRLHEALKYSKLGMKIYPNLGENFFQAAKIHMALNNVESGLSLLAEAIERDSFYALKAAGDGDFKKYERQLRNHLEELRLTKFNNLNSNASEILNKLRSCIDYSSDEDCIAAHQQLELFLLSGNKWPLVDICELSKTINSLKLIKIQLPGETVTREETYQVEEIYKEKVIIKPAKLFRRAITEFQDRKRLVTKTRTVKEELDGKIIWAKKRNIEISDSAPEAGKFYYATAVRIENFGAFVKILPDVEGLIHISQMDIKRVENVSDILKKGDKVIVKCIEIGSNGRVRLSRKEALDEYRYGGKVISND